MPQAPQANTEVFKLRLMCTTDLHMALYGYDYLKDRPDMTIGLERLAPLIQGARKDHPNAILFDVGDILQGNPMGDLLAADFEQGRRTPHPMIQAMNTLGYDAIVPGNHDFNFGMDFAEHAFAQAAFPVVLSNNAATPSGSSFVHHAVIERQLTDPKGRSSRVRIGVLGLLPPQYLLDEPSISKARLSLQDTLGAAKRGVDRLRRAKADLVVALVHAGHPEDQGGNGETATLTRVPGIDAIMCAHSHQVTPDQTVGGGTPPAFNQAAMGLTWDAWT